MTETEWLASVDPWPLLEFQQGKASVRQWGLFVGACLRAVGDRLDDAASRRAVQAFERFADGLVSFDLVQAVARIGWKNGWEELRSAAVSAVLVSEASLSAVAWVMRRAAALWARSGAPPGKAGDARRLQHQQTARAAQADCLRDLFGNPFRP